MHRRTADSEPATWWSVWFGAGPGAVRGCAHGEFDMCRNGRYTERGIKELDGYGSELWCVEVDYAVKLDPRLEHVGMLMEPTTVLAKAWEQVYSIGRRACSNPAACW